MKEHERKPENPRKNWLREFENTLPKLVEALKKIEPQKIILFGSWAKDEFRESSDIDIVIIKETNKRWLERITEARLAIPDEILIKYDIDILVYTEDEFQKLAEERRFIKEIKETGRVIYERQT